MEFHLDTGGMPFPQAHKALFSLQFFDWRKKNGQTQMDAQSMVYKNMLNIVE